jgi:hypothetical protein
LKLPPSTNQDFHPSILARMLATRAELRVSGNHSGKDYQTGLYEPESIKAMLGTVDDPETYCKDWSQREWYPDERRTLDDKILRRIANVVKRLVNKA